MASDRISLSGMMFFAYHGARSEERVLGQRFIVDIDAWADLRAAGRSDALSDTVNYSRIYRVVRDVMGAEPVNLLESLGERIAAGVLMELGSVERVKVRVAKPAVAIAGSILREAAVTIDRKREL